MTGKTDRGARKKATTHPLRNQHERDGEYQRGKPDEVLVRSRQRLHEADEQEVDDVVVAERVERQGIVEVLSEELKRDRFVMHDPGDVRFV